MRRMRFLGLGLKVAVSGGRGSLARFILMATGIGLGVGLLLGALTLDHAIQARGVREATRLPGPLSSKQERTDSTLTWGWLTAFDGHQFDVVALDSAGHAVLPGLPRVPQSGEAFVSPALASLLQAPSGELLRARLGRVTGLISPQGLSTPSELLAYVGVTAKTIPGGALYIGGSSQWFAPSRASSLIVFGLAILAFVFPVALFVVTATRLSTSTREGRFAAIRLAGATNTQVRGLIAIEAGLVGVFGVLVGCGLFLTGRAVALRLTSVNTQWFASDLWPEASAALVLLFVVPILVLLVSLVGSRRIVVSPLGLIRRTRRQRGGARWAIVALVGLAGLGLAAASHSWVMRQKPPLPGVILVGLGLAVLVGLVGAVGWLGGVVARRLASKTGSVAIQLGARRLEADPGAANRVVAGVAVLIVLVGLGQAVVLADIRDRQRDHYVAPWLSGLPSTTVIASAYPPLRPRDLMDLTRLPGVSTIRLTREATGGGVHMGKPVTAIVATDGQQATLEEIRNALLWTGEAFSVDHWRLPTPARSEHAVTRVVSALALVVLLVTGASLLVSTVDGVVERRRSHAMLSAIGASPSVLRRTVFAQVAIPLAIALVLGCLGALLVTSFVFRVIGEPGLLPFRAVIELAVATGLLVLAVTACTMPWVKSSQRPDLLHAE